MEIPRQKCEVNHLDIYIIIFQIASHAMHKHQAFEKGTKSNVLKFTEMKL